MEEQTTLNKITIRNEREIRIIHLDYLYAVTIENYLCTFFIENEKKFICTNSLKELLFKLPSNFIRINRSCIINLEKVESIDLKNNEILMPSNLKFMISIRNKKRLKDQLLLN
jgi:DNA-binding LytR/AlgR family response regulator